MPMLPVKPVFPWPGEVWAIAPSRAKMSRLADATARAKNVAQRAGQRWVEVMGSDVRCWKCPDISMHLFDIMTLKCSEHIHKMHE